LEKAKEKYIQKQGENKKKADELKDAGNKLLGEGKIDEAIATYKQGIEIFPTSILFSNLSAAHSQKGEEEKSVEFALKSIEIDPTYVKAYGRVATAYFNLGKYKDAKEYFSKASQLDPNSKTYQDGIKKCDSELGSKKKVSPNDLFSSLGSMFGGGGGTGGTGGLDFGSMMQQMNNPQFMQFAQQMMKSPEIQNIISSPQMGEMLSSVFNQGQNSIPKETIDQIKTMEEYQSSEVVQRFVADLEKEGFKSCAKYVTEPDVQNLLQKLGKTKGMDFLNPFVKDQTEKKDDKDPDTSDLYL